MDELANLPKKRAADSAAAHEKVNVYIWDMDETLVLFKSLLDGTYAEAHDGVKDAKRGVEICEMWKNLILDLCNQHFFYDQIEDHNEPSLGSLSKSDDGCDLAEYNFDRDEFVLLVTMLTKENLCTDTGPYPACTIRVCAISFPKLRNNNGMSCTNLLTITPINGYPQEDPDPRLDSSVETPGSHHVNVLVTSGALVPSIAKCLLYRFNGLIKHGDVYSALEVGKLQCFEWVSQRFSSPNIRFCVIGDWWEECTAVKSMGWPFVQVNFQPGTCFGFPGLTLRTLGHYFSICVW